MLALRCFFPLLFVALLLVCTAAQAAGPAREHPYLFPVAEKARLLARIDHSAPARQQFDDLKAQAGKGDTHAAAIIYMLTGDQLCGETVRKQLLQFVRGLAGRLDADIAAGGHREGLMFFYWDTEEVRWFDIAYPLLSDSERAEVATFFRKLGHYWISSYKLWTTTPNLVFPIHYHAAVIGYCIDDAELVDWGLHDDGGQFGPGKGGLFPVLDAMLRDGAIWDEATLYAAVNVVQPMVQLCVISRLYAGRDLYREQTAKGASVAKLIDGYLALTYPREQVNKEMASFRIATYGDGSTESPLRGHGQEDLYLVNTQSANTGTVLTKTLEVAYYLSDDPKYAWFLSRAIGYHPSFLYGKEIDPAMAPPPAPSSIFPEAGIAMLRADESPNYWLSDSPAVLQLMAKGYGHGHRDKLSINFHAAGRLLYPDINCVQYEAANVHWTRSGIAHNTLVVDKQDPSDAHYQLRHDFSPPAKFLSTSAECYPGVQETRALVLTPDYLLDLFRADSDVPHTYDWVIHGLGKVDFEYPELAAPSTDLMKDYWWIEDERRLTTSRTWRAQFIQQAGLEVPGYGFHDAAWFNDRVGARVTMIGEPGTQVYRGYGPSGGPPMDAVMNPEGNIPLLLARRTTRSTVFAAVHEPYKTSPGITSVRQSGNPDGGYVKGYLTEIHSPRFYDRVVISFLDNASSCIGSRYDPQELFAFKNYAYLRYTSSPRPLLIACGDWQGFRVHCADLPTAGALTVNGKAVTYVKTGEYVRYGNIKQAELPTCPEITLSQAPPWWVVPGQEFSMAWTISNSGDATLKAMTIRPTAENIYILTPEIQLAALRAGESYTASFTAKAMVAGKPACMGLQLISGGNSPRLWATACDAPEIAVRAPLELISPAAPLALPKAGVKKVTLRVKNWSPYNAQNLLLSLKLPADVNGVPGDIPLIPAGENAEIPVTFTTTGKAQGYFTSVLELLCRDQEGKSYALTAPLKLCIGPVLLEDQSFPAFGEYVIYTPNYTLRLSQLYGMSRSFTDDRGRPIYASTFWNRRTAAEYNVSTECLPMINIDGISTFAWGKPNNFLYTRRSPAAANMLSRSRYEWQFDEERIAFKPELYWSEEKAHEIVFPANWITWGGAPHWLKIWSKDEAGQEKVLTTTPTTPVNFVAAALQLPGQDKLVVFGVDRPQTAHFNGAELRFTIKPGELCWFGLCPSTANLDDWVTLQREKDKK